MRPMSPTWVLRPPLRISAPTVYWRFVMERGLVLKCLYLVVRSLDPTGRGRHRWMNRWKPALNAFAITFEGRIFPDTTT